MTYLNIQWFPYRFELDFFWVLYWVWQIIKAKTIMMLKGQMAQRAGDEEVIIVKSQAEQKVIKDVITPTTASGCI